MKRFPVLLLILSFAIVRTSFAQDQVKKISFLFNTGFTVPVGPDVFSDNWRNGFNLGAGIGCRLVRNSQFQALVEYNSFAFDLDKLLRDYGYPGTGISVDGGTASIFTVSANIRSMLSTGHTTSTPYFVGSLSFFRLSTSDATISHLGDSWTVRGDSENTAGLAFGAGMDIKIYPYMNLFVEGKYSVGFTDDETTLYLPIKVGLELR